MNGSPSRSRSLFLDFHCGVKDVGGSGSQCNRKLNCTVHTKAQKKAVIGRSSTFDVLLAAQHLKKLEDEWKDGLDRLPTEMPLTESLDPDRQCCVELPNGTLCNIAVTCGIHSVRSSENTASAILIVNPTNSVYLAAGTNSQSRTLTTQYKCSCKIQRLD